MASLASGSKKQKQKQKQKQIQVGAMTHFLPLKFSMSGRHFAKSHVLEILLPPNSVILGNNFLTNGLLEDTYPNHYTTAIPGN
jgi:hypothetical protein